MKHLQIPSLIKSGRPNRDDIIQKDEIQDLIIDLETRSPEEINKHYFERKEN